MHSVPNIPKSLKVLKEHIDSKTSVPQVPARVEKIQFDHHLLTALIFIVSLDLFVGQYSHFHSVLVHFRSVINWCLSAVLLLSWGAAEHLLHQVPKRK